jgi:hypothetical protein
MQNQQARKYDGTMTTDGANGGASRESLLASNSVIPLFPGRPSRGSASRVMKTMIN